MADAFSTTNVWPNYSASNVKTAASSQKKDLGKDQFLSILVAQLKNQDPTAPMDNAQFVAQMAQFSSVEQLINIGDKLDKMQGSMETSLGGASELIGKKITWLNEKTDPKTGVTNSTYESGVAQSIIMKDKVLYAQVGEDAIPLSLVTKVEPATASAATQPEASTTTPTETSTTPTTSSTTTPTTGSSTTPTTSTETPASTTTGSTTTTPAASTEPAATETKASEPTATGTTEDSTSSDTASESTAAPAATATGTKSTTPTTENSDSSTSTSSSNTASSSEESGS